MIFQKDRATTTWAAMVWVLVVMCCATGESGAQTSRAADGPRPLTDTQLRGLISQYVKGDTAAKVAVTEQLTSNPSDVLRSPADVRRFTRLILTAARTASPCTKAVATDLTTGIPDSLKRSIRVNHKPMVMTVHTPWGDIQAIVSDDRRKNHITGNSPLLVYLYPTTRWVNESFHYQKAWISSQEHTEAFTCAGISVSPLCMNTTRLHWNYEDEIRAVSFLIDEINRCLDVDGDRIYLMGEVSGGRGVWSFAVIEGDRFAAIADADGECPLETPEEFVNLRNVNMGVFVGKEDKYQRALPSLRAAHDIMLKLQQAAGTPDTTHQPKPNTGSQSGYRLCYNEYPRSVSPFGFETDELKKFIDPFFKSLQRDSYPRTVVWNPVVEWKTRFYNIGVAKPHKGMKIRAEMKEDNTVIVTSTDVPELTVYLNEQLVDMKKPVKVIWNGQPAVEVEPVLRLSVMLQTLTEHYDEGMFYTFKVELKGKP